MSDALICLEMGDFFQAEGNYPAAADAFQRAISIDPQFARSYYCQANLERELGKYSESFTNYNKAIALDPAIADFYNNRGLLNYEMGNPQASIEDFQKAIELKPDEGMFLNNLGVLYQCLNQLEPAKALFEKAMAIDPSYLSSYCNLGIVYSVLGDQEKAIEYYDQAIALNPSYETAYNSKCLSLLTLGHYEEGWEVHEWRWKTNYKPFPNGLPEGQLWTGEQSLAGKSILIQSEQGFGDIIQFCRYLPLVEDLGAKIIFRTEKAIIKLMQSLPVDMQIIAMDETPAPTDYHVPILSLPLIFKTTLENIPSQFPYLSADPEKSLYWKSRIEKIKDQRPRVGLVWAGAPRPQKLNYRGLNSRRDIPLKLLEPLLKENVQFFSLQKGASAKSQLVDLESSLKDKIIDWTDELQDFSDTAALIDNLDIVVCVDTSTAHLAGAMNKPVFLLNRKDTCWRWLEVGEKSPWYSSIQVFRQKELLQWDYVIDRVIAELRLRMPSKIES
jgi:Tfp pilus assembly protein PilF